MAEHRFDIVGGGFSGMALAWYLSERGAKVALYEAKERLGGLLDTSATPFGLAEKAANGFLASYDVEELLKDLKLTVMPSHKRYPARYIFRGGPRRWPLRVGEWSAPLKLLSSRVRGFKNLTPRPQESLREWSLRHWGPSVTDYVVEPAFQGIFAAPLENLSANLCLKNLYQPLRRGHLRGTLGVEGGMRRFIDTWTVELLRRGVEVNLCSPWTPRVGRAAKVVLCLSPQGASQLFEGEESSFVQQLSELPRVGLTTVTAFFAPSSKDLRGFGVLLPKKEQFHALGVLFNTDIFWERGEPHRSETYIFSEEPEDALASIMADRKRIQGSEAKPLHLVVNSRPQALPLYGLQLERFLTAHSLSRGRYRLFGNSYGDLGLSRMLSRARSLADQLMTEAV